MNNYFEYNWYRNGNNIDSNSLMDPKEGFLKGNMFRNLYNSYKNYQPANLTPKNEKEKCLYDISAISFAAHELNLYLDLHPEDQSMFLLFMDYQKKRNRMVEEYEQKYGPLTIHSEEMKGFTWSKEKWPWEGRNV